MNLPTGGLLSRHFLPSSPRDVSAKDAAAARAYVDEWWHKAERFHPKNSDTLIGMPKPYIVPSYRPVEGFDYEELYYWDSYFIAQGLLDDKHKSLVCGILEDLLSLERRYKVIPNASRTYLMGRSQPPYLTSFIFDIYDRFQPGNSWLSEAMKLAQQEYELVWQGTKKPHARLVHRGLSRYYDINLLHDLAEAESGWDMTPRFNHRALQFVPVDLNALLYKYETDFGRAAHIAGKEKLARQWQERADARAQTMNELMWDSARGLYFDYDYVHQRRSHVASLASYVPLWVGMASEQQAAALVRSLRLFEHRGGLTATDALPLQSNMFDHMPMQWAYPNGWAPLHFMTIKGLERYGYHNEARRIALKWLRTNIDWFTQHHEFLEKYNVVHPSRMPVQGVYPTQKGFGWTNAIFERLCRDYLDEPSA